MNKLIYWLLFVAAISLVPAFKYTGASMLSGSEDSISDIYFHENDADYHKNGKKVSDHQFGELYTHSRVEALADPKLMNKEVLAGLKNQLKSIRYFKKRNKSTFGNLSADYLKLEKTITDLIDEAENNLFGGLDQRFDAFQIKGEDGLGNVRFTGYFTPVLPVSDVKTSVYKYPIYTRPNKWSGKLPSRKEIDGDGILNGMELEIGYAKNLVDIYFMQVQGSGIVEFRDGRKQLFSHNGSNGHSYRSIGRHMVENKYTTEDKVSLASIRRFFDQNPQLLEEILFVNPSYVFFSPVYKEPIGAAMVPLVPEYSIAVDTRYIPMGSCLLAQVPIVNRKNAVTHHEYRLLLAQDIGGAIKGPGHVDLYMGVGDQARRQASALHHYGSLWLLLSKDNQQLASR